MADRVIRMRSGRIVEVRAQRAAGRARELAVVSADDGARPQAAARPLAPARPGARHRAGGRLRRRGPRHDAHGLRLAACASQATLLRATTASPTSSRSLKRAPEALRARASRRSPACARCETRIVADVTLDVPGLAEPAIGRLVSIPERRAPVLERPRTCAAAAGSRPAAATRCSSARPSPTANRLDVGRRARRGAATAAGSGCASSASRSRRSTSTRSAAPSSSPTTGASACSG